MPNHNIRVIRGHCYTETLLAISLQVKARCQDG